MLIGALLVLVSPIWLYAFWTLPDPVLENRAYISLLGFGFIAADLAQQAPFGVLLLITAWAAVTYRRAGYWQTRKAFWGRACEESPHNKRAHANYTVQLSQEGKFGEAAAHYEWMIREWGTAREAGTAAANLSIIYMEMHRATGEDGWRIKAAELLHMAKDRWPRHQRIFHNRGAMFMGYERWHEAIDEFTRAIEIQPSLAEAYRNRARCWGRLGDAEKAAADAAEAEKIDGVPSRLRFVKKDAISN